MQREIKGKMLDDRVRLWLESQGDDVHFVDAFERQNMGNQDAPLDADFMVLRPFPLAIMTMVRATPNARRMKEKRLLAGRIALAERFGKFLPVIVVVTEFCEVGDFSSYADAVFAMDSLPPIRELVGNLRLNAAIQKILEAGNPGEVAFSEYSDVQERWSKVVTFADLCDERITFRPGTLARRIQQALVPLQEEAEAEAAPSSRSSGRSSTEPWFIRSRRVSSEFDRVLFDFVAESCGGKVQESRFREDPLRGQIFRHVWNAPNGARVVIRRQSTSGASLLHKSRELIAEAWMTRAFAKEVVGQQILLLGEVGQEARTMESIGGTRIERYDPKLIGIQHVNALESAGWIVSPWDFEATEPEIIRLLKEVAK
jgi:hypothetical protein